MEDQSNPRVQAHAAAALINFTEDCPKSLLIPYLDSLVQHLHVIMVAKLQEVQLSTLLCTFPSLHPVCDSGAGRIAKYHFSCKAFKH